MTASAPRTVRWRASWGSRWSWARTSGRGERSTTRCWYSGPGEHGRRAIDD